MFWSGSWRPQPSAVPGSRRPTEAPGTPSLKVLSADLLVSENGKPHHTFEFELMERVREPRLVVRRGQPFAMKVTLNRALQPAQDAVSLVFTLDGVEQPTHGHGTLVAVPLLAAGSAPSGAGAWSATLEKNEPDSKAARVLITPSADAIVGQWRMEIDTKRQGEGGAVSYSHPNTFFLLFNPWCRGDAVYLQGETLRHEYVLNDTGEIWRGSYNRLRSSPWQYAQFEKDVLECSMMLISKIGKLAPKDCADPVRTVRAISAAVNSNDDNGALTGNWTEDYSGGTNPLEWGGSMKILQQYWKTRKPVKYGQCWVFAGVVTTICRALGIPSRPVTNFSSAHDTQSSLTIDNIVDDKGVTVKDLCQDTVWNYHVWNEAWMSRPDLGDVYSGWQVIDATPQEKSELMFRCGPTSVVAVKRGEVLKQFDGAFVFAEVNADKLNWRYNGPTQPLKLLGKDMNEVGQFISTKAVGSKARVDLTQSYKFRDESKEERAAMLTALKQCPNQYSRYYLNEDFNDIKFDFELRDDIVIGQPFSVVLVLKNFSTSADHSVSVTLRVDAVTYRGQVKDEVRAQGSERTVKAGGVEKIRMDVSYDQYAGHLVDQASFNIACMASVKDTQYEYFAQDDFRVRKPDIKFKLANETVEGREVKATVSLTNPLPVPLLKGTFLVEGPGIPQQLKLTVDELAPQAVGSAEFKFTPRFSGKKTLSAKFLSKELNDVDGFLEYTVKAL